MKIRDKQNRILRDLRISVTDRCNYRCVYCMPRKFYKKYTFLQQKELLTFEELQRVVNIFTRLGVIKVRLTGGEPLLRKNLDKFIARLAQNPSLDIGMTTNGSYPLEKVEYLKRAGLRRMTVSLDALDDFTYRKMNDVNSPVEKALNWIAECEKVGFTPVKINSVIKRGLNENSILPLVERFRNTPHVLRFIEFMDVGNSNGWNMESVVPAQKMLDIIDSRYPIEEIPPNYAGEVARRYKFRDGGGEIGMIASVTRPFCGNCSRIRISAHGSLYLCLFATKGTDLRAMLRGGATDDEISDFIINLWSGRSNRYSEERSENSSNSDKVEMSFIGG